MMRDEQDPYTDYQDPSRATRMNVANPTGSAPAPATGGAPQYATPATGSPQGTPQQFITQWQQSHPASEGIAPLADALSAGGYAGVSRYMYGATPSNNELSINGQKFKVISGEDSPSTAAWYTGGDDSAPGARRAGGGGSAAYVPGQGVPGMGSLFGGGVGAGEANPLFQLLMSRAQGNAKDPNVDPNSPLIKGQVDAFDAQQQRAERNYEAQAAERVGANANMGVERRIGHERIGQNDSAFQAQLMGQELTAKRQEIEQALAGATGFLTAQQQMQLQEELQQLQLAQSAYQFDSNDQFRNSPLGS